MTSVRGPGDAMPAQAEQTKKWPIRDSVHENRYFCEFGVFSMHRWAPRLLHSGGVLVEVFF